MVVRTMRRDCSQWAATTRVVMRVVVGRRRHGTCNEEGDGESGDAVRNADEGHNDGGCRAK
jgi:hypothetical protein